MFATQKMLLKTSREQLWQRELAEATTRLIFGYTLLLASGGYLIYILVWLVRLQAVKPNLAKSST